MRTPAPEAYRREAVPIPDFAALPALQTPAHQSTAGKETGREQGLSVRRHRREHRADRVRRGSIVTGFNGRDRVHSDLAREQIVGTPDSSIPNQLVNTGTKAEAFAKVMRKHTLEATGGQTYSQMGRYMGKNGKPTNDEKLAAGRLEVCCTNTLGLGAVVDELIRDAQVRRPDDLLAGQVGVDAVAAVEPGDDGARAGRNQHDARDIPPRTERPCS